MSFWRHIVLDIDLKYDFDRPYNVIGASGADSDTGVEISPYSEKLPTPINTAESIHSNSSTPYPMFLNCFTLLTSLYALPPSHAQCITMVGLKDRICCANCEYPGELCLIKVIDSRISAMFEHDLDIIPTWSPFFKKKRARCDPKNPLPPVISIRLIDIVFDISFKLTLYG